MKTKMNQWFKKVNNVFCGVAVLVFALSLMVTACKSGKDELPEDASADFTELTAKRFDNERLVALAVCRVYDGKGATLKSSSKNTDENYPGIKYPFDFVRIHDAMRFTAQRIDFPLLNEICGKGEIEVFLTSFETYIYAEETKDENFRRLIISDGLIVFRGEWGIYACMDNGGSSENGVEASVFSSHKRFADNAVEKDFTPPIYNFFIMNENEKFSLACNVLVDKNGNLLNQPLQWTKLEGGDIVGSENLFRTEELQDMPETSQQCTITDIGEDYFMVSGTYNLEKIFFDEYTRFFAGDQPAKATEFAKGDVVTVTFNKPYERYNPKVAVANQIIK